MEGRTAPREGVVAGNLQGLLGRWSQVIKYAQGGRVANKRAETRWLGRHRVSRPVRTAAAAAGRLPPGLEYYGRVRGGKKVLYGMACV